MAANRITIEIVGAAGRVPIENFLRGLEAIIAALERTEVEISGLEKSTIQFDLTKLHSSNPTVELEAHVPPRHRDYTGRTIQKFLGTVNAITQGRIPKWMDLEALETYKELAGTIGKDIQQVKVKNSRKAADITPKFRDRIEKMIGPDQYELGSILGRLEMLSIHQGNRFALYPRIGPKRIVCNFKDKWLETVQGAIGRNVEAFGTLKYKARSKFPHEMDVDDIEVKPRQSDIPSLQTLKSEADLATEEISDDFMLALANDW